MQTRNVVIKIVEIDPPSPGDHYPVGLEKEYVRYRIIGVLGPNADPPNGLDMANAIMRRFSLFDPSMRNSSFLGKEGRFCLLQEAVEVGEAYILTVTEGQVGEVEEEGSRVGGFERRGRRVNGVADEEES